MKILQFLLLSFIILLASCEKDDVYENELEDVNVVLRMHEDTTGNNFYLEFQTHKKYPCLGYPILSDINNSANTFSIHLKEVGQAPEVCRTAFGPASAAWKFPLLGNGEYPISIKVSDDKTNKGKMIISDNKYEVKMETLDEIHFPNGTVLEY